MWLKLKKMGCCLLIIVLLPYVVTVFINGPSITAQSRVDQTYIQVEMSGEEAEEGQVIEMALEDYGIGVMAKEIPADYEKEALKAQAVLVRTDIYRQIQTGGNKEAVQGNFWNREEMQEAWGGKDGIYYRKFQDAWQETEGQILTWQGQPAYVPFFRLSIGCTRDGKEVLGNEDCPYLQIRECPDDVEAQEQLQTVEVDDMDAEVTALDTAGYVTNVRVGQENMSGEEFRKKYELASSCFTLQRYNGKMRITTRGVGHGLGMSQYSAHRMAKDGQTYDEILNYFFEGCEQKEVAEILQNTE
ncbi:MAG: SpoIID/LytB domain-containing protein [Merdimonas faecis]|uniref:SpoIID/LytB domain-containing protein n=1 Tax=Merdimonas faecis TaxID=1653435 RepID=UPI003990ADDB